MVRSLLGAVLACSLLAPLCQTATLPTTKNVDNDTDVGSMYPVRTGVNYQIRGYPLVLNYRPRPFGQTQLQLSKRDIEATTRLAEAEIKAFIDEYSENTRFSPDSSGSIGGNFQYPTTNVQIVFRVVELNPRFVTAGVAITGIREAAMTVGFVEEAWIEVRQKMMGQLRTVAKIDFQALVSGGEQLENLLE